MENFEHEFRQRFIDAQSTEGIDPGELWANIDGALEEERLIKPSLFKGIPTRRMLLTIIILFSVIPQMKDYQFESYFGINDKVTETFGMLAIAHSDKTPFSPSLNDNAPAYLLREAKAQKSILTQKQFAVHSLMNRISDIKAYTFAKQYQKESTPFDTSLSEIFAQEKTSLPFAKDNTQESIENQHVNISTTKIPNCYFRPIEHTSNAQEYNDIVSLSRFSNIETLPSANNKPQIGFHIGTGSWKDLYPSSEVDANLSEELSDAQSVHIGSVAGLVARLKLNKSFQVQTGIDFFHMPTRFDYVKTWDTTMIRSDIPGELIAAEAVRTVQHYNQRQFISMPFLVGCNTRINNIELGINSGIQLNYFFSQKGKSLNKHNDIVNYSQGNSLKRYDKLFFSFNVQPYIQYHLTNSFSVELNADFRYQIHGISELNNLNNNSILNTIRIGAFWGL